MSPKKAVVEEDDKAKAKKSAEAKEKKASAGRDGTGSDEVLFTPDGSRVKSASTNKYCSAQRSRRNRDARTVRRVKRRRASGRAARQASRRSEGQGPPNGKCSSSTLNVLGV